MRLVTAISMAVMVVACSVGGRGSGTATPDLATATPTSSAAASDVPPAGLLAVPGAEVVGLLGTYCWNGLCADMFETPPATDLPLVDVSAGELTFDLEDDASFLSWSASYRSDDGEELTPLAEGGADFDPDTGASLPPSLNEANFDTPPVGDWVLIVQAFFENGDAQYIWHVVVE